jgi:heat shock protein HslJ
LTARQPAIGATIDPTSGPAQISFEENGYVSGSDGCNGFGYVVGDGPADPADGLVYEVVGDEIVFEGSPVSTLIGCSSSEYEGRVRHVLTGTMRYELSGERLTLVATDGSGAVFTRE